MSGNIFRLEDERSWVLEIISAKGASTVWDDLFDTDADAPAAFLQAVSDEGMATFLDEAKTIHFRR